MSENKAREEKTPETPEKVPGPPTAATAAPEVPSPAKKKRRWMRILGWTVAVIVILLVAAIIARDAIIKAAVVNIGSAVTGTKVEMDSFSSSFAGTVEISGFRVANPEGYRQPYAFQVGRVRVSVNIASLFSDKIEVREVLIEGTRANFEMKLDGSSNLTDIQKNVEAFSGGSESSEADAEEPENVPDETQEESEAAKKQVVIRLVRIEGTELSVSSDLLKSDVPLPVPPITLENLGDGKSFGETLNEFTAKVLMSLSTALSESGIEGVGDALKDAGKNLGESLKQSSDALKEAGKNLGESLKGSGDSLKEAGKNIEKGLRGLFNKE